MTGRLTVPLRIAAVAATAAVVSATCAFPAAAADGDVQVVNTETVQIYTSATGEVESKRIYEQVSLTGSGSVDLRNPIGTDGLRNLEGFGGFDVEDGNHVAQVTVDGEKHLRSVSDFTDDLPLDVKVEYFLDGQRVEPGDVVGEDGELEVKFIVKNVTAVDQEVSFPDGEGGTVTKTVSVPIPMVGSLTTVAPENFTNVESGQANMAGDGKGGTKLSFTMTLFPPVGSDTAEFGYTADITDGVVPPASISALPVNPLESPTFKTAADSYKGGADTGVQLTDGAIQIDSNLLKLRDGAAELLAGLIKLRDGAQQLEAGLAGEASPGANRLADGAGQLADGTGQLVAGANKLSSGAGELSDGAGRLAAGAEDLHHGTGTLVNGTGQLRGGAEELEDGAGRIADGSKELAAGAGRLEDGAGRLDAGAKKLAAGTVTAADGADQLHTGAGDLSAGLGELSSGALELNAGAGKIAAGQQSLLDGLRLLESGVQALPSSVRDELRGNLQYQALLAGMGQVVAGIGTPNDPPTAGTLLGGLNALKGGLEQQIVPGIDQMLAGIPESWGKLNCASLILADLTSADAAKNAPGACFPPAGVRPPMEDVVLHPVTFAVLSQMSTQLADGRDRLSNDPSNPDLQQDTLQAGLTRVKLGITGEIVPGLGKVSNALYNPLLGSSPNCSVGPTTPADPTDDCGIGQAVGFFKANIPVLVDGITGSIRASLLEGISVPATGCDPENPTLICGAAALSAGGADLQAGTAKLLAGAGELDGGGQLLASKLGELAAGLDDITGGAGELSAGAGQLLAGAGELSTGAGRLSDGAGELHAGTGRLVTGVNELDSGAQRLQDGAGDLSDGAGKVADGSDRVADGAGELADGAGQLDDGAGQIADGADQLADGLGDAAEGSGQLAGGLEQAADGAPKLVDGAQRLSDEGTSQLVEAGKSTAANYGEMYATIQAGAERAQAEKMIFGTPEGAIGLAAYSYEIKGEDGEGTRNWTRGLGGLAVLAAGAGAFALRRRVI